MVETDEDPDQLRAVFAISVLDFWFREAQEEITKKIFIGITDSYPSLTTWMLQLRVHGSDYPELLSEYNRKTEEIHRKYGTRGIDTELSPAEAQEIWNLSLKLSRDLGPSMIDSKYARGEQHPSDDIEFPEFEE